MKVAARFLKKTHFCPLIFTNIYSFMKPRLHIMTRPYEISLLIKKSTFFLQQEMKCIKAHGLHESLGFMMDKTKLRQTLNTVSKTHHKFHCL